MVLEIPKGTIELYLNKHHNVFLDYFFKYFTYLGDGIVDVVIILVFFSKRIYYGIVGGTAFLVSTIVSQSLKRFFFAETLRPKLFFEGFKDLYYIDGIEIHSHFSFPSGHSSGAFTICCFVALISRNKKVNLICFFAALFTAFSRIYLMQHFFIDTYFGALIGVLLTLAVYYYFENYTQLKNKENLQKSLFSR